VRPVPPGPTLVNSGGGSNLVCPSFRWGPVIRNRDQETDCGIATSVTIWSRFWGEQQQALNAKLRGHYAYYGITPNSRSLQAFWEQVKCVVQMAEQTVTHPTHELGYFQSSAQALSA
jgi:hypothetical protein